MTWHRITDQEIFDTVEKALHILFDCSIDFAAKARISSFDDPSVQKIRKGVDEAFSKLNGLRNTLKYDREVEVCYVE